VEVDVLCDPGDTEQVEDLMPGDDEVVAPLFSSRLVLTGDGPFCLVRGLALLHNMVGTRKCGEDLCRRRHACSGALMTLWLDLFALDDCRFARLHECTGSSQMGKHGRRGFAINHM
jgi:hypothetical protein